jgi:hypothetical protein
MRPTFNGFIMPAYLINYDGDGAPVALHVPHKPAERRTFAALKRIERHTSLDGRPTSASPVKTALSDGLPLHEMLKGT